jgi:hypothetical protein
MATLKLCKFSPTWFCLRLAHQEQSAALQKAGVQGHAFAAWAAAHELDFDLAFTLQIRLRELIKNFMPATRASAASLAASSSELQTLLTRYAAYEQRMLPEGVGQFPPQRGVEWALSQVPPKWARFALDRWESRARVNAGQASLVRPADGLFATTMAGFSALGVNELSMGELQTLIRSHLAWTNHAFLAGNFLPHPQQFYLLPSNGRGLKRLHDAHLALAGGFKATPSFERRGQPGEGGEGDFFARLHQALAGSIADVSQPAVYDSWGKEVARLYNRSRIRTHFQKHQYWSTLRSTLKSGTRSEVEDELKALVNAGFWTEPAEREKMRPALTQLLQSRAGSKARMEAAQHLVSNLTTREKRLNTVSITAATANIQVAQATARHVKNQGLDVTNPHHRLNIVDLYRTYRRMLIQGELTSEATVRRWLVEWDRKWGVPFVP